SYKSSTHFFLARRPRGDPDRSFSFVARVLISLQRYFQRSLPNPEVMLRKSASLDEIGNRPSGRPEAQSALGTNRPVATNRRTSDIGFAVFGEPENAF